MGIEWNKPENQEALMLCTVAMFQQGGSKLNYAKMAEIFNHITNESATANVMTKRFRPIRTKLEEMGDFSCLASGNASTNTKANTNANTNTNIDTDTKKSAKKSDNKTITIKKEAVKSGRVTKTSASTTAKNLKGIKKEFNINDLEAKACTPSESDFEQAILLETKEA